MGAEADAIWNRATTERPLTAPGDGALQALLVLHGQIRNGGLLSALDYIEPEDFERAIEGFAYFGQHDAAELLAKAYSAAFPNGPIARDLREQHTMDLPEAVLDEIEASDERYHELFPTDSTLAALFERRLAERPNDFAPLP